MEKNKVQNDKIQKDKVQPDDEISNEDLDKVAGGATIIIHPQTNYIPKAAFASKTYDVK